MGSPYQPNPDWSLFLLPVGLVRASSPSRTWMESPSPHLRGDRVDRGANVWLRSPLGMPAHPLCPEAVSISLTEQTEEEERKQTFKEKPPMTLGAD